MKFVSIIVTCETCLASEILRLEFRFRCEFFARITIDDKETIKRKFCSRYVLSLLLFYIANIPL